MQHILLLLVLGLLCVFGNPIANDIEKDEHKDESPPAITQDATAFDYDYANEPRRYPSFYRYQQQKSSQLTTTPRPFVSYWQNLMRNVRLPVPSITWNVTNPLANLFPADNEEFAPGDVPDEDYYTASSQRRHKSKKKRKQHHHNKRHRKHKRPLEDPVEEQQLELENAAAQTMLPQYPINNNVDLNTPMYFYDPNTDAYYAVQRVRALGSYTEGTVFNPKASNELNRQHEPQTSNEAITNDDDEDADDDINLDEAIEIDLDQVAKNDKKSDQTVKEVKSEHIDKPKNAFLNEETLRNVLGNFMRDDSQNRQKQRSKEKRKYGGSTRSRPRKESNHYFLLDVS